MFISSLIFRTRFRRLIDKNEDPHLVELLEYALLHDEIELLFLGEGQYAYKSKHSFAYSPNDLSEVLGLCYRVAERDRKFKREISKLFTEIATRLCKTYEGILAASSFIESGISYRKSSTTHFSLFIDYANLAHLLRQSIFANMLRLVVDNRTDWYGGSRFIPVRDKSRISEYYGGIPFCPYLEWNCIESIGTNEDTPFLKMALLLLQHIPDWQEFGDCFSTDPIDDPMCQLLAMPNFSHSRTETKNSLELALYEFYRRAFTTDSRSEVLLCLKTVQNCVKNKDLFWPTVIQDTIRFLPTQLSAWLSKEL